MWLPLFGLVIGIICGSFFTFAVPPMYASYLSVAVLAALDSLIGGWRSILEEKFDGPILMTGFITNALLAAGLAYLGDLLGLDLYLAAVIAFGLRIFANIGVIRRHLILRRRKRKEAELAEANLAAEENNKRVNVNIENTTTIDFMDKDE